MQIRTALAIGSGIAIGVIFGMGVSDDTKCKVLGKIRNKLIYMLGGEVKKVNYMKYGNHDGRTYYSSYYEAKPKNTRRVDIPDKKLLFFETKEDADKCLSNLMDIARKFKTCSVHDLSAMRERSLDHTWDVYGWSEYDLEYGTTIEINPEEACVESKYRYELVIPRPKYLK